jgi:hypothetical protein
MELKILLLMLIATMIVSGCTGTGSIINRSESPESSPAKEQACPDGCPDSVAVCGDGFEKHCRNICIDGRCSSCIPNCRAHPRHVTGKTTIVGLGTDCTIHCGACENPDEETCTCQPITPCCGNSACEPGESGTSCPEDCREPNSGSAEIVSLNAVDEFVAIENKGNVPLNLESWTISDAAGHVYTFPSFYIQPSQTVTIHTGTGSDTQLDLYWNSGRPVWNNDGDTAILKNDKGEDVSEYSY